MGDFYLSTGSLKKYTTGIPGLDRLIGEIVAPYTILLAGHPGAGKTTLATTICYANTLQGKKCLYLSFYEDKEKYYRYMKRLGLDLESAEAKGLFKFIRLPLTLELELVMNEISKTITEGYDVVVVDSVSVLLEPVMGSSEKRAWLLNYFYQLPALINGLVVLVAELPFGEEKLGLGSVEFVVDAMVLLKHRVEEGFLTRILEVRKARGAPIHIAETYFTITEGYGVSVFTPPVLAEIPYENGEVSLVCSELEKAAGHYHRGFIINVFYPAEPGVGLEALLGILALAVKNNMRALVVSYTHPSQLLHEVIKYRLIRGGLSSEKADKVIEKYMAITALNPFAHSLTQLAAREQALIDQVKPGIVVFYGVHLPRSTTSNYAVFLKELFNEAMYLKSKGIIVFRVGTCLDEYSCSAETSISDLTYRFERVLREDGKLANRVYVYRRFREPRVFGDNIIDQCMKEWVEFIKQYAEKL
jgi:circadian clock protein KaiC